MSQKINDALDIPARSMSFIQLCSEAEDAPVERRAIGANGDIVSTVLDDSEIYTTSGQLLPVAYSGDAVPTELRLGQDAEVVNVGPGHYRLVKGTVLTSGVNKLTIDTEHAAVVAKAGTAVLISTNGGFTQVLNLLDRAKGDVNIIADMHSYSPGPGRAVGIVSGASKTEAVKLVCKERLARRKMQILDVSNNTQLVTNDFSVLDALQRISLLSNLRKSPVASDQQLFSNMVKIAAALSMTTDRSRGSYSTTGGQ